MTLAVVHWRYFGKHERRHEIILDRNGFGNIQNHDSVNLTGMMLSTVYSVNSFIRINVISVSQAVCVKKWRPNL